MKKLKKVSLYEQAYQAIRSMILGGQLRLGETVAEAALAEQLGVSRTPVREAFKSLIVEGLLTSTPAGTITVFAPSLEDVAEVYVTRAVLEGFAAHLLVISSTPKLIRRLEYHAERCAVAAEEGDIQAAIHHNGEFHGLIVQASKNTRIASLLESLAPVILRYSRMSVHFADQVIKSSAEHLRLMEILSSGAPDEVEAAMRDHILRAGTRTIQTIEQLENVSLEPDTPLATFIAPYRDASLGVQSQARAPQTG